MDGSARVAVLEMEASTPAMRTRLPAGISSAGMKYLTEEPQLTGVMPVQIQITYRASLIHISSTVAFAMSSSSSGE